MEAKCEESLALLVRPAVFDRSIANSRDDKDIEGSPFIDPILLAPLPDMDYCLDVTIASKLVTWRFSADALYLACADAGQYPCQDPMRMGVFSISQMEFISKFAATQFPETCAPSLADMWVKWKNAKEREERLQILSGSIRERPIMFANHVVNSAIRVHDSGMSLSSIETMTQFMAVLNRHLTMLQVLDPPGINDILNRVESQIFDEREDALDGELAEIMTRWLNFTRKTHHDRLQRFVFDPCLDLTDQVLRGESSASEDVCTQIENVLTTFQIVTQRSQQNDFSYAHLGTHLAVNPFIIPNTITDIL